MPPICFQAGFYIRGHRVMSHMTYILLYGVVGTLISMVLFTEGLVQLSKIFRFDMVLNLNLYHILLLASLLSNWETHSCIVILDEKEYPTLTSLMFGETMVNDGAVIALFNVVHHNFGNYKTKEGTSIGMYLDMLLALSVDSLVSILIGIGVALVICFIMRRVRKLIYDNQYVQMMIILVGGYMSFMLSEMFAYSGALTIFCSGFILSYYGFNNMSDKGKSLIKSTVHFLGFIPESFIFAYIGLTVPVVFLDSLNELLWLIAVILGSFYIRTIMIYFLYLVGCLIKRKIDLYSFKSVTMLIVGGMIRGKFMNTHRHNSFWISNDITCTRF